MQKRIFDCITFFQENLQAELRFNILDDVVDQFIVCESRYDHRGLKKKINFDKAIFPKFKDKINHLILKDNFPKKNIPWENQAFQRVAGTLNPFSRDALRMIPILEQRALGKRI